MDELVLILLFALASVFVIQAVKKHSPQFAFVASICAGCIILIFISPKLEYVVSYIEKWQGYSNINTEWLESIIKICVVCFVGQWGIQICRDAHESSIADKMEMAIKIIILIMCFPYIDALFDLAVNI
jgi:stage III sporulation protein AD